MPQHSDQNLYPGVNPHLNSFLQQRDGGWESFHARYISVLTDTLEAALPDGYYAIEEKSLQILALNTDETPARRAERTTPDVTVYQTRPTASKASPQITAIPTMTFSVEEAFIEEETLNNVTIYRVKQGKVPGEPVTRLEVLSPGNKPGGLHYEQYIAKRQYTLKTRLALVEIDFLHEAPPLLHKLHSYPDCEEAAQPYAIIVSDPRPDVSSGTTEVYTFGVLDPIPTLNVPLDDQQSVIVDFGVVYNRVFASRKLFSALVDYTQEPLNFKRYCAEDQARIRQRMAEIAAQNA